MHFERTEHLIDQAAKALPAVEPGPDWRPLEALLGPALQGQFMFMGRAAAPDGTPILLYKHGMTRRYLNLSADLRTWAYGCSPDAAYQRGTYRQQPLAQALAHVFEDCEGLGARPTVPYDDAFCAQRDAALAAAGYRVITAVPGRGVA